MAGTKLGGSKAARTNIKHYGRDFYARIGALGGKAGHTGGFAADVRCNCKLFTGEHALRRCAGKKGGMVSRRGVGKKTIAAAHADFQSGFRTKV